MNPRPNNLTLLIWYPIVFHAIVPLILWVSGTLRGDWGMYGSNIIVAIDVFVFSLAIVISGWFAWHGNYRASRIFAILVIFKSVMYIFNTLFLAWSFPAISLDTYAIRILWRAFFAIATWWFFFKSADFKQFYSLQDIQEE